MQRLLRVCLCSPHQPYEVYAVTSYLLMKKMKSRKLNELCKVTYIVSGRAILYAEVWCQSCANNKLI
jgi:hypothetical protein